MTRVAAYCRVSTDKENQANSLNLFIDRELWDTVQQELKRRSRDTGKSHGHGNRYPLSGKIRCAECGSSFLSRRKNHQRQPLQGLAL